MKYVLDSCVAIKWALPEPETPRAARLMNDYRLGVHELLSPDIFPVEVAHAIARAERRGVIRYSPRPSPLPRRRGSACTIVSTWLSPSARAARC